MFNTSLNIKIASKYPNVIAVVSSCSYIVIILTFTYACLLLKVHGSLLLDFKSYISYCHCKVTEGVGEAKLIYDGYEE